MDLKTLLDTRPENLAEAQHKALRAHVAATLNIIRERVLDGRYDLVREMLFDSPAGDGMGSDNVCINFDYTGDKRAEPLDISMVLDRLEQLRNLTLPKKGK